ncbi:MAG: sugar ABC transporter ATP-binding protein [Rubrobacteraceae bacterium]|nr:sugar ABC transporter ATP-binding protein [Rubrobacteraceae bacterium]
MVMEGAREETPRPLLLLKDIDKHYGGVHALKGVNFEVRQGEVHALAGKNGAGKSTLIKIIAGADTPDAGEIYLDGKLLRLASTRDAIAAGVATVYQEPSVFPDLTVVENIFLGREILDRYGNVDWSKERKLAHELFERLDIDPRFIDAPMRELKIAIQQLVLIAKALAHEARVIIFDEPSAILTQKETETLFEVIKRLKSEGVGIIYISHRLEELTEIADRVTILRDGEVVTTRPIQELTVESIEEMMEGHKLTRLSRSRREVSDKALLQVRGLTRTGAFEDISFEVRKGEILGFFGLVGSGAADIGLALFGAEPADGGKIEFEGRPVSIRNPQDAAKLKISFLPEDRKTQGIFGPLPISYNLSIGNLGVIKRLKLLIDRGREDRIVARSMTRMAIKAPSPQTEVNNLSGGNQQKVLLGRLLIQRPKLLILEEPTHGVDVGSKEEIHTSILELAQEGIAVIVISSELPEILRIADRVYVMWEGRIRGEYSGDNLDPDKILNAAVGERR